MKSQKGEVVTGLMIVMMVGMMIFGAVFMHGGHKDHGGRKGHMKDEMKQEHSETGTEHMHEHDADKAVPHGEQENN